MKMYRLLVGLSLLASLTMFSLEKPETPDINPETKSIADDVKSIKAEEKAINTLESKGGQALKFLQQKFNNAVTAVKNWYQGATSDDLKQLEALATRFKEKAEQIKSTLKDPELKAKFNATLSKLSHELNQIGK
jgi:hypothetical protein